MYNGAMNGFFKGFQLLVVLIVSLALLSGCTMSAGEQYADFLMDGDIEMRFHVVIDDIEQERAGAYTLEELKVLKEDLRDGYDIDDPMAEEVTSLLRWTADLLYSYLKGGCLDEESFKEAKTHFASARQMAENIR